MITDELIRALIEDTTLDDISESYRPVVQIIGIEKFIELSDYCCYPFFLTYDSPDCLSQN